MNPIAKWMTATAHACLASALSLILFSSAFPGEEVEARSVSYQLNIPAEQLDNALQTFALASHHKLLYRADLVAGKMSHALKGAFTTEEAVRALLSGTGLQFDITPASVVLIKEKSDRTSENAFAGSSSSATPGEQSIAAGLVQEATPETINGSVEGIRLAQVDQAKATSNASVVRADQSVPQSSTSLSEIVVTAQKREERLQDVPISIGVLSGESLDKSSFQGAVEALNTVPGVTAFTSPQGGGSVLSVRGVTTGSALFTGSSAIAYYVDGVPFGFVSDGFVPDTDAYDLARVEVLRGPQGTLYGADSLNGVVRLVTNDANLDNYELHIRGSDSGTDGGGNNYRGDMAVNVPIIPGVLAARAVVGYEDFSGWIDKPNADEKDANDTIVRNARLKINAQPTDNLTIGLSAWLSRQNYGAPNLSDAQGISTRSLPEWDSIDYGSYGLKVGYKLSSFDVTSTTSYLNYVSHDVEDFLDILAFDVPLSESWDGRVFSEEMNLNSTQSGPWRWSAGLFYRDASNSDFQHLPEVSPQPPPSPLTLDWTDTSRSVAIFGEVSRRFLDDKFEWTLGARYFHDDVGTQEGHDVAPFNGKQYYRATTSFEAPTPRAVLTWHPAESAMVYTSFSEGFRSGLEQVYYAVNGQLGFPPAKPDKLYNYEIGAKADLFDKRISLDTAVYYMDWKQVQSSIAAPFAGTYVAVLVNAGSASGEGFEIGLTARPSESFDLSVNYSWNNLAYDSNLLSAGQVEITKGERLQDSPKETASASANYRFPLPLGRTGYQGRLSVSENYSSPINDVTTVGVVTLPANSVLMTRAGLSVRSPVHWEWTLYGDNLTNWQGAYLLNNAYSTNREIRLRPRTVGLQFEYR